MHDVSTRWIRVKKDGLNIHVCHMNVGHLKSYRTYLLRICGEYSVIGYSSNISMGRNVQFYSSIGNNTESDRTTCLGRHRIQCSSFLLNWTLKIWQRSTAVSLLTVMTSYCNDCQLNFCRNFVYRQTDRQTVWGCGYDVEIKTMGSRTLLVQWQTSMWRGTTTDSCPWTLPWNLQFIAGTWRYHLWVCVVEYYL